MIRLAGFSFFFVLTIVGCELFEVGGGSRKPLPIERSQRSSPGVVLLFTSELESGTTAAATELMLHPSGRQLLAVEKFELADDLLRWKAIMAQKPISETVVDTISDNSHTVRITLDYLRVMQFTTLRTQNLWYVTRIQDASKR